LFNIKELKTIFKNSIFYNFKDDIFFDKVEHDTRRSLTNAMYLALKGANFDGHNFLKEALLKGAKLAIVERINKKINLPQIKVKNTLEAYLKLAKYKRKKISAKIIAITGSNGKTTSKDLLFHLLDKKYKVYSNFGNFNNNIGLSYTILNAPLDIDFLILEMGMNKLKEIKLLSNIACPDLGLITNIGTAHIGELKGVHNILKAKLELFDYLKKNNKDIIFNTFDKELKKVKTNFKNSFNFIKLNSLKNNSFSFKYKNKIYKAKTLLKGDHNLNNIAAALSVALFLNVDINYVIKRLKTFDTKDMRFEEKNIKGITYILDCYNANLDSMKAIIDYVSKQKISGRKVAVIGDMNELGKYTKAYHIEIGKLLNKTKIDKVFCFGKYSSYYQEGFNNNAKFIAINDLEIAKKIIKSYIKRNDLVFFKASRSLKLEKLFKEVI